MRFAIFGDESTLLRMGMVLGDDVCAAVIASNRPQSAAVAEGAGALKKILRIQPPRSGPDYKGFVEWLRRSQPDGIFCFSYSMVLGPEILGIPRRGAVNFHGGLLPEFRGSHIHQWTLIEDRDRTGMTAHYMTEEIDAGDMIGQRIVAITDNDDALSLKTRVDSAGFEMLADIARRIRRGQDLPRRTQDPRCVRYYPRRKEEDGRIRPSMTEREIFNLVRALVKPWPGAFYLDRTGHKVVLDRRLSLEEVREVKRQILS